MEMQKWMLVSGHYQKLFKVNDDLIWFEKFECFRFSFIEVHSGIAAFAGKKKTQWLLGIIALCKGPVHNSANYANELFQNVFVKPMPNSN